MSPLLEKFLGRKWLLTMYIVTWAAALAIMKREIPETTFGAGIAAFNAADAFITRAFAQRGNGGGDG